MFLFIASSFSLSLLESNCFPMFLTLSSGLSKYAEPEARRLRSLVCSERVSCSRAPSLAAFSVKALRFKDVIVVCGSRYEGMR